MVDSKSPNLRYTHRHSPMLIIDVEASFCRKTHSPWSTRPSILSHPFQATNAGSSSSVQIVATYGDVYE